MQKLFIIGFAGRDPEERFTSNGKKVTSFPVGINTRKGGEKLTIWYKVNCWGEQCASILPHVKKGSCVVVTGDLSPPTTYQSKTGDIKIDMSISAHSISFAPSSQPKEEKEEKEDTAVVSSSSFSFGGDS